MKKIPTVILLAAMIFLLAQAGGAQVRAGLRFYGGLNFLGGGDLNTGGQGWFDLYKNGAMSAGYSTQGTFSPAHLGLNFGGEIMILFKSRFGLGLGADYISATRTSDVEFRKILSPLVELSIKPKATAIPLKLSFYYFLPAASWLNIVLQAGGGFYLAKSDYHHRAQNPTDFEEITIDAKANGLGFHGGLGFEFRLAPRLGLLVEFLGRYASFSGFEGKMTINTSTDTHQINGNLYLVKAISPPYTLTELLIASTEPAGPGISSEKAKLNFSGFSLRAGFFMRF